MHKRHRFFWKLLRPLIIVFLWIKFGYTAKIARDLPDNYIVLANHATDFDPLMVAASFPRQMYFVASEHVARWKRAFKWLDYAFAPIMRYKGTVAASTVVEVLRRVRKGANVAIFAEGARTWDGVTGPILPSTAKLIKSARCGLVTYKLVGGYFVSPMWSYRTRRGYCHGEVANVYSKEQIAAMSQEELYNAIVADLYEDAYARQEYRPREYRGKGLAEGLQNLLFICPKCGGYDTFVTSGSVVCCHACGWSARYTTRALLEDAPYATVKEFSRWQNERVARDAVNGAIYHAPNGTLISVQNHIESPLACGEVSIDGEYLRCGDVAVRVADISDMAMHGKRALVFSAADTYYELIPSDGVSALKFWLYYQACTERLTASVT